MVLERSQERRSRKCDQFSSPMVCRAISKSNLAASGSPVVLKAPRTRAAAGNPDSRCKSLAPLFAANTTNDSKSIVQFYLPTSALAKSSSTTGGYFLEHLDAMRNRSNNKTQTFNSATRFARQAEHQRLTDHDGKITRQNGILGELPGLHSHCFTETR